MKNTTRRPLRIGIYPGAFDPVHAGHIAFALQAMRSAGLDQIVFMPERQPRHKPGVTHYAHRVAMIKKAILPHPDLAVLETVARRYSVTKTLPLLQSSFPGAELVLLLGSDAALTVPHWPFAHRLLQACELVVGVRSEQTLQQVSGVISAWPVQPKGLVVLNSYAADISSSEIRLALSRDNAAKGLLRSVQAYARREWLYVSPSAIIALRGSH